MMRSLFVLSPYLPFDVIVRELASGEEAEGPGGLRIRVAEGDHTVRVLAYRLERPRAPRFDPERARALGVPIQQWSVLQGGDSVTVDGRVVVPRDVLGEERPGVALGFATDTRPCDAIRELMTGVDLLISEGTFGRDEDAERAFSRGHMTFREAATQARDARVGHLWLTHFSAAMTHPEDWRENAASVFPDVSIGYAGLAATLAFDHGYQHAPDLARAGGGDAPSPPG
jgi:ribonuclease Z